jgi:hypothetical protein
MTKSAIIHIRTTAFRKEEMLQAVDRVDGYTQTRLVEEGVDLMLKSLAAKGKKK